MTSCKSPVPPDSSRRVFCPHGHQVVWTEAAQEECTVCGATMTAEAEENYCCNLPSVDMAS